MDPFAALSIASAGLSLFGGISGKKAAEEAADVQQEINLTALAEAERQLERSEQTLLGQNMLALAGAGITVPGMPEHPVESINDPRRGATGPEYAPYDFGEGTVGAVLSDISREFRTTRDVMREQTRLQNEYAATTGSNAGTLALMSGIDSAIGSILAGAPYFGK